MNKYFGDWYKLADPAADGDTILARQKAAAAYSEDVGAEAALDLVRLAYKRAPSGVDMLDTFTRAFLEEDAAFPMRNNAFATQVLAGCTLDHLFETSSSSADVAALALVAGELTMGRGSLVFPEVLEAAGSYLAAEGARVRSQLPKALHKPPIAGFQKGKLPSSHFAALKKLPDATSVTAGQVLDAAANSTAVIESQLDSLASLYTSGISDVRDAVAALQEETNVLWWVLGGCSRDLGVRFASISESGVALIAGKELADLTMFIPFAPSSRALLTAVLGHGRDDGAVVTLSDALVSAPADWLESWIASVKLDSLADFCTLHRVASLSLVDRRKTTVNKGLAMAGASPKQTFGLEFVAYQVLVESLLIEAMGNSGS